MKNMGRVAVVGGGVSGYAMSLNLSQLGYKVDLFEKRKKPGQEQFSDKRSYNLTICNRGLNLLSRYGVRDEIIKNSVHLRSRKIYDASVGTSEQRYGSAAEDSLYSISREALLLILDKVVADEPRISTHYEYQLHDVEPAVNRLVFKQANNYQTFEDYDFVVGSDGSFSKVRDVVANDDRVKSVSKISPWVYKKYELDLESNQLSSSSIHMWRDKAGIAIGIPSVNGQLSIIYCTKVSSKHSEVLDSNFKALASAHPILQNVVQTDGNEVNYFKEVSIDKWFYNDKIVLVGDAAHSITPFYGQGMNFHMESCTALQTCLMQNGSTEDAFQQYQSLQRPAAIAISRYSNAHIQKLMHYYGSSRYKAHTRVNDLYLKQKDEYELITNGKMKYHEVKRFLFRQKLQRFLWGGWLLDAWFTFFYKLQEWAESRDVALNKNG